MGWSLEVTVLHLEGCVCGMHGHRKRNLQQLVALVPVDGAGESECPRTGIE